MKEFCAQLESLWKKCPELRFGQFMCNIMKYQQEMHGRDLFYVSNEEFLKIVSDFMKNYSPWTRDQGDSYDQMEE